jgi:hypothetical protein
LASAIFLVACSSIHDHEPNFCTKKEDEQPTYAKMQNRGVILATAINSGYIFAVFQKNSTQCKETMSRI